MNLLLRTVLFGTVTGGVWVADQAYQRPREAASASAAVAQLNDPVAAQNLDRVRQNGAWSDLAAGGVIVLAGVACFGTWRPRPVTKVVDRRAGSLQKESV